MYDLLKMTRPVNGLMTIIGVLIGVLLTAGISGIKTIHFLFAVIAVFLINSAGNVFNDYIDVEADKINKPTRPIPAGKVKRNTAFAFSIILFILGNIFAFMINGLCALIAFINSILLIFYSTHLQHKILIGNLTIAYLVGSVFLFGGSVFLDFEKIWSILILSFLAMSATLAREIVKDLEDIEGDKKSFLKKLTSKIITPIAERFEITTEGVKLRYSERVMIILAVACIFLAVIFSIFPYYYRIMSINYLFVILLSDLIFISSAISLVREPKREKGYGRISRRLKLAMFIALIAFIVGVFI
ncbi:MAG: UbiA family prenyltransferase [Candidatus Aenigmatarchaeota archaeon]